MVVHIYAAPAVCALAVAGMLVSAPSFPDAAARAGALPGGRILAAGPFVFYATLYADPALRLPAQARAAWLASDVPGVGARLLWLYRGPGMRGPVVEQYGPLGTTSCVGGGYAALRPEERGGRAGGGLILPVGARLRRRAGYVLAIDTPSGRYGVVLSVTLRAGAHGPTVGTVAVGTVTGARWGSRALSTPC